MCFIVAHEKFLPLGGATRSQSYTPLAARRLTATKVPCPCPPSCSSEGVAAQYDHFESTASTSYNSKKTNKNLKKTHEFMTAAKKTAAKPATLTLPRSLQCATNNVLENSCPTTSFIGSPVPEQPLTLATSCESQASVVLQAIPSSSLIFSQQEALGQEGVDDPLQEFSGSSGYNSSSPDQEITRDPRPVDMWSEKETEGGDGPNKREPRQGEH